MEHIIYFVSLDFIWKVITKSGNAFVKQEIAEKSSEN
jgi:hypothetical protein